MFYKREPMQIISWWNKQEFELCRSNKQKTTAHLYIDDRACKYSEQTMKEIILDLLQE